jgi:23S rRNA (uracil1939-C5)-methyltransferase
MGAPTNSAQSSDFCVHQPQCVGCPLASVPYPEQLRLKRELVLAALSSYPDLATNLTAIGVDTTRAASPTVEYRGRAKLVSDGRALGLFGAQNHEVLDLPHCRILRPRVAQVVASVRRALPLPFELLAVDAREADPGVLLNLIVTPETPAAELRAVAEQLMQAEPLIAGVSFSQRAKRSAQVLGGVPQTLLGAETLPQRFGHDQPFHVAVSGTFVQAHAEQAAALHAVIEDRLNELLGSLQGATVLELYAGAGALALRLAKRGARVLAVDSYAPGIERLENAAAAQGISLEARAEDALTTLARKPECQVVVVDPPRRGLSPDVRSALGEQSAQTLVMVSCEPTTLARDLAHLARLGWHATRISPWDMIPQSESVETLVFLARGEQAPPRVLYADEQLIVVDKPPFLPTTPQTEHTSSLLHAVQQLPDAAEAAAVHRLDRDTSGVCLFARKPHHVYALAQALAAGQKQYIALTQGVVHKRGQIQRPLRDGPTLRAAQTRYQREQLVGTHSLVSAYPVQGRKHQIRKHFAAIGHPILGDARYGKPATQRYFDERHGLDRPFLHCASIRLVHAGVERNFEASLAPDLSQVLESLRKSQSASRQAPSEA